MYAPPLPVDADLPAWGRRLVGLGVMFLHLLLVAFLLHAAGQGELGAGDQSQGPGTALSVPFVTLTPPTPSVRVPPASVALLTPTPENGLDTFANTPDVASAKTRQVLSEVGNQASTTDAPRMPLGLTKETAAAATAPAANGGRPEDNRLATYHAALRAAVRKKWMDLTARRFPSGCTLRLNLAVGGPVNATSASGCAVSDEDRLQLEAAALMAQPLPYAGYESVFQPDLALVL